LLSYLNSYFQNFKYISFIFLYIFCFSFSDQIVAEEKNKNLENVYKLLQEKNFQDGLKELQILCEDNNIQAQLLFSKILFSGDLTPQDFENSYFWSSSALLGGLKKSEIIIEKLNNYLTEDKIIKIKENLRVFLEKKALNRDKRAIIQIAKFYEMFLEPADFVNAYTWYSVAVAQGIKTAKTKRDELINELNEKDLLEAQTLSIKLFKQINN
jgi:TPR repeat protein